MPAKRDTSTKDLFRDFVPEPVVPRFSDAETKAWNLTGRLALAVKRTLDDAGRSREQIAQAMSDILKEPVSKATLDTYASQAKEDRSIRAVQLAALIAVTNDPRALNTLLADFDLIVVPRKFEPLIKREIMNEAIERMQQEQKAADAEWKARR